MLTKFLLAFRDDESKLAYQRSKYKYYVKSVLLVTLFLLIVSLTLEAVNFLADEKPFKNPILVSIINWATFLIFAIMCFCIRKAFWGQKLVCPILTVYVFLVVIQSDPAVDMNSAILFTKAMLGMQAVSFILVMFNEAWFINTGIFALCTVIAAVRIEI